MPQLHMYVPEEIAQRVKRRAAQNDKSVSQILAEVVEKEFSREWPVDFAEKYLGKWQGPPIEIERLPLQERDFGLDASALSEPSATKSATVVKSRD